MQVPQGTFDLQRHPSSSNPTLRAWDAADEYVLHHLAGLDLPASGRWLIANDTFGALACALVEHRPWSWSDSSLAHEAARRNLDRNGLPPDAVSALPSTQDPPGPIDVAVVKVPRTLALLEDQLHRLRPRLAPDALVVGTGMVKHVHTSTIDAFEATIGPTPTSLARRKARLLHPVLDPALDPGPPPGPTTVVLDGGTTIVARANVFSQDRLDIGTRALLDHLPTWSRPVRVVDVGCGSGVLGTVVASGHDGIAVTFTDESHLAVDSARATFAANHPGREATFLVTDGVAGVPDRSADVVVCNPPFHARNAREDRDAWEMFTGARRVLDDGGEFWVVGNRHLGYHAKLARLFGDVEVVGSTPKFVILRARP